MQAVWQLYAAWLLGEANDRNAASLVLCALLGITASFALNILVELTMLRSEKYDTVAEIQYSVPIWLGILLYGIISPMVEEMVFRGVIFNRARKFLASRRRQSFPRCCLAFSMEICCSFCMVRRWGC